jgi:hypothetical protein
MLLAHARTLAYSEVTRGGVVYSKLDPTLEDAEDWEPLPAPQPEPVVADCGCDGVPFTNDTLETLDKLKK